MPIEIAGVEFLSVLEVAQEIGVTPQTVRSYIHEGRLKADPVGRSFVIRSSEVTRFRVEGLSDSRAPAAKPPGRGGGARGVDSLLGGGSHHVKRTSKKPTARKGKKGPHG